ncbi:hypothetical protein RHSIM_Rhsim08G0095500 [Rhododendron simsii]|uniref:Uncharacterized protein n=1 Tax=Rhododendron simsii TaxID=118357 RepID=A0A834LHV1_RHOSS|nr:hypothetical protein RHSIM_Rhsim08G0095500 [Rhododendron simsii]
MTAAVPPQIRSLLKVQSFSIAKTNYTMLLVARHDSRVHLRVVSVLVAAGIHWQLDCQRLIMPHAMSLPVWRHEIEVHMDLINLHDPNFRGFVARYQVFGKFENAIASFGPLPHSNLMNVSVDMFDAAEKSDRGVCQAVLHVFELGGFCGDLLDGLSIDMLIRLNEHEQNDLARIRLDLAELRLLMEDVIIRPFKDVELEVKGEIKLYQLAFPKKYESFSAYWPYSWVLDTPFFWDSPEKLSFISKLIAVLNISSFYQPDDMETMEIADGIFRCGCSILQTVLGSTCLLYIISTQQVHFIRF